MKICFLGGGFGQFGGIERVTSLIANEIAERNLAIVHTLSMADNGNNVYPLNNKIIRDSFFQEKCSMKLALCKGALQKTIRYIKEYNIDILIACGIMYFPLTCIAAKFTGIKSICWEHTNPSNTNEVTGDKEIRFITSRLSDANVLISQAALNFYNETYRKSKNCLIHNPTDPDLFLNCEPYERHSKKLISVGRLTYQKNYPLLVDVASRVLKENEDWSWDIFGDGRERADLAELIADRGLAGKLNLCGTVSDLYARYPRYSAIIMTSRWEGFPMVLIEAAAKGLPMISFDIPTGPSEIIEDGVNGYLIPAEDVECMVERIHEFIASSELRERMSFQSRETARRFGIENTIQLWTALFDRLVESEEQ